MAISGLGIRGNPEITGEKFPTTLSMSIEDLMSTAQAN
jgi:hypothetical protein